MHTKVLWAQLEKVLKRILHDMNKKLTPAVVGHVVKHVTGLTNVTQARTICITGHAAMSTPWQNRTQP